MHDSAQFVCEQDLKKRDFQMDLLRVAACLLVVWQHVSEYYYIAPDSSPVREASTHTIAFITSLCRASVPLFVMVSGYFLLPMQGSIRDFFRRRCVRIVGPFVFWCIAYAIFYVFSRGDSWVQCMENILHIPVNFGTEVGHLWYIYMLLGLYLLVPILSPWLQTVSKHTLQIYLGLWALTTLLGYVHLLFPEVLGECFWNPTPMLYYFTGFAGYFVLGFYMRRFGAPSPLVSCLMLISGYAVTSLVFNARIDTAESVPSLELSWQQCSANVALMAAGLFGLFRSLRWQGNDVLGRIVSDAAKKGYGIYLAHLMVLSLLAGPLIGSIGPVAVEVPLISIAAFILTYLLVWILSALPHPDRFRYLVLALCCQMMMSSCSHGDNSSEQENISAIAERVWTFSQTHPDGFTLDIRSGDEPTRGIAVSYAATQGSHSRSSLNTVVAHALSHDGYVGGWFNISDSLYYFDSTRLFPEDSLAAAIRFGKANDQQSVFIISTYTDIPLYGTVAAIVERDTLLVGTTGDYRPLSFCEPETGEYWGFGIDIANDIACRLGVEIRFVKTSWPTLSADVQANPPTFDMAIGGITITEARCATMLMSEGYLANGKTILCRASDADRYLSLADIDKPEIRVMVNPGGLNEKFAHEHLTHATIIVHEKNEEIPLLIAEGQADVMITEITEAPFYVDTDPRLAAPLLSAPFTQGEIGILMRRGQDDLLQMATDIIRQMKADGSLRRLHEKYGLIYAY